MQLSHKKTHIFADAQPNTSQYRSPMHANRQERQQFVPRQSFTLPRGPKQRRHNDNRSVMWNAPPRQQLNSVPPPPQQLDEPSSRGRNKQKARQRRTKQAHDSCISTCDQQPASMNPIELCKQRWETDDSWALRRQVRLAFFSRQHMMFVCSSSSSTGTTTQCPATYSLHARMYSSIRYLCSASELTCN